MKLWLDDERLPPLGWTWVKTARDAIRVLETGLVRELSLDHDLGPPEAGTGYDVAVWLEEQAAVGDCRLVPPTVHVHSANPVGRRRMEQALTNALRLRAERGETER